MGLTVEDLSLSAEGQGDWTRNIVSLRESRSLFASLVDDKTETGILQAHEMAVKPYRRHPPILHRPFEFADTFNAIAEVIDWPFEHPATSRFSEGYFGCWYGAEDLNTSIYETGYHFVQDALDTELVAKSKTLVQYRRVHVVECTSLLLDLRPAVLDQPGVYDNGLSFGPCQALGAEAHRNGLRGIITYSARDPRPERGAVACVLTSAALARPRIQCYLTYRYNTASGVLSVEREPGVELFSFKPLTLAGGVSS